MQAPRCNRCDQWIQVCIHKCQHILTHVHALDSAEPGLRGSLSQALQRVVYVSGDFIIREGDIAEAMFFITSGKVDVVHVPQNADHASATPLTTLGPGSFFGEVATVTRPLHARYTAGTRPLHGRCTAVTRPSHGGAMTAIRGCSMTAARPRYGCGTAVTLPFHGRYTTTSRLRYCRSRSSPPISAR